VKSAHVTWQRAMTDYTLIRPPAAPSPPRGHIVPEWRAPWLQDPRHKRPDEREPPLPEFDDEIERYLFYLRNRPLNLMGAGH
jgi:hypothetical protein